MLKLKKKTIEIVQPPRKLRMPMKPSLSLSITPRSPLFDPTHGNDTWLKALKSCIPKSKYLLQAFDCIDKEGGGYDHLDSSMKLKLLNFLCDEIKEAKERLVAAKDKEKCLKQKKVDAIAEARRKI
ncbi:hypothetical protein Ccrd_018898 [Cynara cardunculus var. scolymus]|uniref:Uncharacterized protein n=1 Tax=Cynara cardunculus var. scolymus TaxID=59895 RepID=A0A103Y5C1_CYNCS|nr:hypothetical protein Ccrd_018898 [Cynara cardunculus var. scolymus]